MLGDERHRHRVGGRHHLEHGDDLLELLDRTQASGYAPVRGEADGLIRPLPAAVPSSFRG
jgi:hypothetical protein